MWAKFIIDNYNRSCIDFESDPLIDFSLVNFLDKFILKNSKVKKMIKSKESVKENPNELKFDFIEKFEQKKEKLGLNEKVKKNKEIDEYADDMIEREIQKEQSTNGKRKGKKQSEDDFLNDEN